MIRIYLAGPDVFRPDAASHGRYLKSVCEEYGAIGLWPLDNDASGSSLEELAANIRLANLNMLRNSDAVVANMAAFRGP